MDTGPHGAVGAPGDLPGVVPYRFDVVAERLHWTPALRALAGMEPDATGGRLIDLAHPDDMPRLRAENAALIAGGTRYERSFRLLLPGGAQRMVVDRGQVERDAAGRAVALVGLLVDISAALADLAAATAPVDSFRALADNIDQLAWIADGSGAIFWYNRRWHEFTGRTLEEMEGWGWTAVHHPDHVDRVVERVGRAFATGEPWEDTFPLRGIDGGYRWFLSRAQPIRDAGGQVVRWFGTNTDVTNRLESEQRVRESEERLRLMADSMPTLVWTADAAGEVLYANRQSRAFAPLRDPRHGGFDWRLLVHPEDRAESDRRWQAAQEEGCEFSCEHRLKMADGGYRWHLSRAVPVPQAPPRGLVWYGTATDIHELKALEQHRLLLQQELEHRVKNTLALVQSIANQTFRGPAVDAEPARLFRSRIQALAGTHDALVRDRWEALELREIGERMVATLGVAGQVELAGPPLKVPPRQGVMLSLALHELGTNAVKYGALSVPEGRVRLDWAADAARGFRIAWTESGGPPVAPPARQGFGTRLIRQALAQDIGGTVELDFAPTGLACRIEGRLG